MKRKLIFLVAGALALLSIGLASSFMDPFSSIEDFDVHTHFSKVIVLFFAMLTSAGVVPFASGLHLASDKCRFLVFGLPVLGLMASSAAALWPFFREPPVFIIAIMVFEPVLVLAAMPFVGILANCFAIRTYLKSSEIKEPRRFWIVLHSSAVVSIILLAEAWGSIMLNFICSHCHV